MVLSTETISRMNQTAALRALATSFLVFALVACGGSGGGNNPSRTPSQPTIYSYQIPQDLADGWQVAHISDQNVDIQIIQEMMSRVIDGDFGSIDAISIARNGMLILDENLRNHFDEFDPWIGNQQLNRHVLHSVSKSFTSALVGIAVDQGYIASVDEPFFGMFTYPTYENWDVLKSEMSLEDALTMRFGLEWDETSVPYGEVGNSLFDLFQNYVDVSKGLLDLPVVAQPGSEFVYNTAGTISVGQALENVVGVPMEDFAEMHLFAPLQIQGADWGYTETNLPNGGSGLFLTSRQMLKFGQLFVDDGVWNGEQILSAEWVQESIQPHAPLDWTNTSGYGYQWWIDAFTVDGAAIGSFSARGYGGQYIFCVPSIGLVVSFTGANYGIVASGSPFALMQQYILPAVL